MQTTMTTALHGYYDIHLVALSIVIAIVASYTALDLAARIVNAHGKARFLWLSGGAVAMGTGIWAMHYVGMLAFRLPVFVFYDWPTVLLSLLAAIIASAIALFVASRKRMGFLPATIGSIFMGSGIAAMHYIGMAAMRLRAMCVYSRPWVAISIGLAVGISFVALRLTFSNRELSNRGGWRKIASAIVMGLAVPTMHYSGMAAITFVASDEIEGGLDHALNVTLLGLHGIALVTFVLLGFTLLTAFIDRRLSAQASLLQSSENWSQQILETAFDPFIAMDMHGQITEWNAEAERTFGWSRTSAKGRAFAETLIPVRRLPWYEENLAQLLQADPKTAFHHRFEITVRCRDGHEIPAEITVSKVGSGPEHHVAAFIRDLSEREHAEKKFQSLLESSPEAILFVGRNGRIAVANSHAEKLFGYSKAQLLNQPIEILMPPRAREVHHSHRDIFFTNPRKRQMADGIEFTALRKDGSEFPAEISLTPLEAEDGLLVSALVIDITARKEKEQALRLAHEKLSIVLAETERRVQESARLGEMLDIFQSCQTAEEI